MHPKILIVGSEGYLGSRLTDYFLESGYPCVGTDVGFFRHGVLYRPKPVPTLQKSARELEEKDLENFDVVLQLAGISNDPFGKLDAREIYDPTLEYALKIAEMCKTQGVRYVFPSSCSVYGIGEGESDENGPTRPQTPYSLNKLQIEEGLAKLADDSFSPIALRLATVFGCSPRIRFDVVINMLCGMAVTMKKVILNSNGQAWRPHVDIEDVCDAFRACVDWNYAGGKLLVLNVGRNDNNLRILDVAELIVKYVEDSRLELAGEAEGKASDDIFQDKKIQDGVDKRTYRVNFDRIHNTLPDFQSKRNVENGIAKLIEQLKKWKLDAIKFKQRDFYRLQQLDFLHETQQISFR